MKTVHFNLYDPTRSIFRSNKNDKAEIQYVTCNLDSCPMKDLGKCACMRHGCPYGKYYRESGFSRKARKFHTWISEKKAEFDGIPYLQDYPCKMVVINEYLYVPYSFNWQINKELHVRWFLLKNINNEVLIEWYKHTDEKRLFLDHLHEVVPALYCELITQFPNFSAPTTYKGRKALLSSLNYPITFQVGKNPDYQVTWKWDGEYLTTESPAAYDITWGEIKHESLVIKIKPKPETEIEIQDDSWINGNTVLTT